MGITYCFCYSPYTYPYKYSAEELVAGGESVFFFKKAPSITNGGLAQPLGSSRVATICVASGYR
ncbi:hypothetical protein R9C00_07070 [Flammeovirgaceae bacterium SG7u.111]|nr:hypothetical protein [Flammeovirgaceae bacterium SG7u.132]WPO37205.1 hypothetical protein R9C00_07070 [Flammeovirgaceae bacterium SG7u.111]